MKVNTKKGKRRKRFTKLVEYSQGSRKKFDGLQKCNKRERKIKLQRAHRRMPWYMAPKKDVTSCEKLRGVANER